MSKGSCKIKSAIHAVQHESDSMSIRPRDLSDHLLSLGRYEFTLEDAATILASDRGAAADALGRLQRRQQVFSPAKGLYVAVPPEYRSWGVLPGDWFIDAMMAHLHRPYYVALLSAARIHGASHQAPQVFQVMTAGPAAPRDRDLGRVRLRFYSSKHVLEGKVERITVPTGYLRVSARETTVVDLITHHRACGGYSNVATILREIGQLGGSELARVAGRRGRSSVRRTGWFVERFGHVDDLEALRQAARLDLGEPALLDPAAGKRGKTDPDWRVRVNTQVEPDL
jgi:predicted transcriptional regulator of viral defense system